MAISPMMQHYLKTKELHKDAIVFYRLGDFYELFFDDAIVCSNLLDLTLTGKDCGLEERAPMCGIPHHAIDNYLGKLLSAGYKVAICEQVTNPGDKPGLVEREVVRIVTPGTVVESSVLEEKKNNYIASVYVKNGNVGVCWADITTGLLEMVEFHGEKAYALLDDALLRVKPSEIICSSGAFDIQAQLNSVKFEALPAFSKYFDWAYELRRAKTLCEKHFKVATLSVFDAENLDDGICAVGALLEYLNETQKRTLSNINKIRVVKDNEYMHLDVNARKNLELTESMSTKKRKGSLLHVLDQTNTSMGGRLLRSFIEQPLQNVAKIQKRLDSVEELSFNVMLQEALCEQLRGVHDIERLTGKISYGNITPRDCLMLLDSLKIVPEVKNLLQSVSTQLLQESVAKLVDVSDVTMLLENAINPNITEMQKDANFIKTGYNAELDELRKAGTYGRVWMSEFEQREKEKTGIKNLKVGFNKVFGYYIEVTNSQLSLVPYTYVRKQTTTNSERFITQELKDMETKILGSEESCKKLEAELFTEIKQSLASFMTEFQQIAHGLATIDALLSLAMVAVKQNYVKPRVTNGHKMEIVNGRHPVVETLLKDNAFVANDTFLDDNENRTMIITGPNMGGKSTYMRQVAVIVLMAHIGSFVPAEKAEICMVDRIFTRIGASDDLAFGQSTFMVEMNEVANILNNATDKSLLILDEVGRGTSTYDGLSIAWAVMEFVSKHMKAKTLFSTHYHELTELEGVAEGVKNYRVMVKEFQNSIVFLHKIARGSANRSFGLEVAALAGLPKELLQRAKEILALQEAADKRVDLTQKQQQHAKNATNANIAEVINMLKELDMNTVSPIVAFGTLQNLVDKVKEE